MATAFAATKDGKGGKDGKKKGNRKFKSASSGNCFYCDKPGHQKKECRKRLADVEDKEKNSDSGNKTAAVAFVGITTTRTSSDSNFPRSSFIVDFGASRNFTANKDWLHNFTPVTEDFAVTLGDGRTVEALGKGTVHWLVDRVGMIEIKEVFYIPKFAYKTPISWGHCQ